MPPPCHRAADPGPRERGQVTVWMLGLAVMLLFLGGLSLDLWRAFTQRQNLANAVEAAAIAGGSGIDEGRFRSTGTLALAPQRAELLAIGNLRSQAVFPRLDTAQVNATEAQVEVVATTTVQFTLLRVLLPNDRPFTVRVRAVSVPRESGT
jgi:Flp pilus assembly protein TadG